MERRIDFPLNVIFIDPDALFDFKKSASFEKTELFRIILQNRKRNLALAKEFSRLGANVLFVCPKLCENLSSPVFEFSSAEGMNFLSVKIKKESKGAFPLREISQFCDAVSKNSKAVGGLFSPDAVFCGGTFPFAFASCKRIAKESRAVLITLALCDPKKLLKNTKSVSSISPVLTVLKKAFLMASDESDAVLALFPDFSKNFSGVKNIFPLELPPVFEEKQPSEKAKELFEKVFAFREGKTFVLASPLPLEDSFSIGELIFSASTFGKSLALVFLSSGTKEAFYKKLVSENGITNVFFLEEPPAGEASFVLSGADAVYLSENGVLKGSAFDSERCFSAFLSKKPIMASSEKLSDFFRKTGGCVITKPRSKESLRLGIKALFEMSEADRNTLGQLNFSFAEKHSFENFSKDCFLLTDNLVKQKENRK